MRASGITVSSRGVTVHRTRSCLLAIDQRVTQAEILGQTDHSVVDGGVAVGMVGTQHSTNGIGGFAVWMLRIIARARASCTGYGDARGFQAIATSGNARATITDIE